MTTPLRHAPPGEAAGTAVLLHGFTRSPRDLQSLSDACVAAGVSTVRPALAAFAWRHSINNAANLSRVAERMAPGLLAGPVTIAGHSAGAAAGAWIGAELRDRGVDVRRLVFIDGNESPWHLMERAWPRLQGLSIRAVCAPPSRCNRDGRLAAWLGSRPGDIEVVVIDGSGHGDIEGAASPVYRWACGDGSNASVRARVLAQACAWIREGLDAPISR